VWLSPPGVQSLFMVTALVLSVVMMWGQVWSVGGGGGGVWLCIAVGQGQVRTAVTNLPCGDVLAVLGRQ
jgi:hypothetical protein